MNNLVISKETGEVEILQPLTAKEVKAQVNLIQEVMSAVMKDGEHYGVIPGCGNKKVLLKAGAEKLASTFKLAIEPVVTEKLDSDGITYSVMARVLNIQGNFLGAGVGTASTKEEKYNWKKASCKAEYDTTAEDKRRIKYSHNGDTFQIRTNPYDAANTVLKMAKKRAFVDAILSVTAASDIFTQDLEESTDIAENNNSAKSSQINPPDEDYQVTSVEASRANENITYFYKLLKDKQPKQFKGNKPLSEGQMRRLFAITKAANVEVSEIDEFVKGKLGLTSKEELSPAMYAWVCELKPQNKADFKISYINFLGRMKELGVTIQEIQEDIKNEAEKVAAEIA